MKPGATVRRVVLSVAALIIMAGCSSAREPRQAIVILLDAARADRLSAYGYHRQTTPNIDRIAERGAVFLNHFVQETHTRGTLPTLFYSRYLIKPLFPYSDSILYTSPSELFQGLDDEAISMVEALSSSGHTTSMIAAHSWLRPGTLFADQFDEMLDLPGTLALDKAYGYPRAEQVVDHAIDWIDRNADRDFFLYIHMMDTHFPHHLEEEARAILPPEIYDAPPPRSFTVKTTREDAGSTLSPEERIYLDALYDGSLRYADHHLGRLFDHVDERLGDTLIALTSDHGEMLMEAPGRYLHGNFWYDLLARVPLIIAGPSIEPRRIESFSEGVDLMPTVLGLLGVTLPPGKAMDGVDLRSILDGTGKEKSHVLMRRALRDSRYKWIVKGSIARLMTEEPLPLSDLDGMLYDLESDPLEIENLWDERPDVVTEMFHRYREAMQPYHRRYAMARTGAVPEGPFALEVRHLWSAPTIRSAVRLLEDMPAEARASSSGEKWLGDLKMSHLVGRRGALPLDFDLRIPDGRYILSVSIRGTGTLRLDGEDARPLTASSVDMDEPFPWKGERIEVGEIRVSGDRITGRITADPSGQPFLIRHLGFTPLPEEGDATPPDEELLERLRTLGYVD